jgi:hypothetical protein
VIGRFAIPLVLNLALALAGLGLLRVVGHLKQVTPSRLLYAAGLGYLVGIAAVFQCCVLLLVIGVPFGIWMVVVLCVVFASPLIGKLPAARGWRPSRGALVSWAKRTWSEHIVVLITLTAFGVLALIALFTVGDHPLQPFDYDAWDLWARKASYMYFHSRLPLAQFTTAPAPSHLHPDYPMVLPLLEALQFRAISRFEVSSVHIVVWLLMVGFVWAGVYLSSRRGHGILGAVLFTGAALSMMGQLLTAYADVPMALFLCLGVLQLGVWLESGTRADLAIGALLLAGAAGIKNEGTFGTIAALVVALVVVAIAYRERLREFLLFGGGVVVLAILPWRVWVKVHDLQAEIAVTKGIDPSYLSARTDRLTPAITSIYDQLTNVESIAVLVPIAIAIALAVLGRRGRRPTAAFYLGFGVVYFVSLVWAYWISPLSIQFLIATSATRIYVGVGVIAVAALVDLGPTDQVTAERRPRDPQPASRPSADVG